MFLLSHPLRRFGRLIALLPVIAFTTVMWAGSGVAWGVEPLFSAAEMSRIPATFPAEEGQVEGLEAFYYEGVPYRGQPTRVFAYYGVPATRESDRNEKLPAMVLIHGGGGTAYADWVRLWNQRGYVALAMDNCGAIPVRVDNAWKRHEFAGPLGWNHSFYQTEEPLADQWAYHAVAGAVLGHNWLRSRPEVDPDRIGLTGISWGGYLTCIIAANDPRYRFACPVYGCGYLHINSWNLGIFKELGPEKTARWGNQWDPSVWLPHAKMPFLWVNGTNDFAFPTDSWTASAHLPPGPRTLCLRVRMPHAHGPAGEAPAEIHHYANAILRQEPPLARIVTESHDETSVWATYDSPLPLTKAELAFTLDRGDWQNRVWDIRPAEIDPDQRRVKSTIPPGATACYLNLFDERDCAVSTELVCPVN